MRSKGGIRKSRIFQVWSSRKVKDVKFMKTLKLSLLDLVNNCLKEKITGLIVIK